MRWSKLPKWLIFLLKVCGVVFGFFLWFVVWDYTRWEPYFSEYHDMIRYYVEDTPFLAASYKYTCVFFKKFFDILAAFIWYWVDVEMTFKHFSIGVVTLTIGIVIDIYVESPKKDLFFLACLILGIIWCVFYFW